MTTTSNKAAPKRNQAGQFPVPQSLSQRPVFTPSFLFLMAGLFAASLGLQLAHHFCCDHPMVMFGFDGKHYLATAQAMTAALIQLFHGNTAGFIATIGGAEYCKNLVWDGPVIPGIPAVLFALAGRLPKEADWSYFAIFFSVLASYSAVLLAVATRLVSGSNRLALTAGLLFALYPTTIIATGVYRSEILAVALMLTLILALYRAPTSVAAAVFAGVVGGVFAMVKPVMIPAIGLLCIFTGFHACKVNQHKGGGNALTLKSKLLLILALAGVLTIAPWSAYTALDCGKLSITAERGPSYNAGVGTDLGADGWCTMPETAHTAQAKLDKSPMAVFIREWRAHPYELARLTLRRVTRLWANPWNDFREPVFGIPIQAQIIWHLILVSLGFMGLALYLVFPPAKASTAGGGGNIRLLGNLVAITLLCHLSFIMFQTMGRYAYTSMPLMALFAAYGLGVLHRRAAFGQPRRGEAFLARAAAFAGIAAAILIFNCDGLTHYGQWHESAHVLAPGEAACRSIDLVNQPILSDPKKVYAILLIVDCDMKDEGGLRLSLNGHPVKGPLLPLNCFNGLNYFLFDTMAEHAAFMRRPVQNFRQWRAVLVEQDASLLSKTGLNEIEFYNGGKSDITIYGDTPPVEKTVRAAAATVAAEAGEAENGPQLLLPSPDYFASDRMLVSLTSDESRINTLSPVGGMASRSYLKSRDGAKRIARALNDRLRLEMLVATGDSADRITGRVRAADPVQKSDKDPGQSPGQGAGRIAVETKTADYLQDRVQAQSQMQPQLPEQVLDSDISAAKFHWFARERGGGAIRINKAVLRGVGPVSCDIDLSPLKKGEPCTQIVVTLTGRARLLSGPGRLGVSCGLTNIQGLTQGLGQFADFVALPKSSEAGAWTNFEMSDVVPRAKLGELSDLSKLSLSFLPCPRLEACYGAGKQCSDIEVKDLHVSVRALNLAEIAAKPLSVF